MICWSGPLTKAIRTIKSAAKRILDNTIYLDGDYTISCAGQTKTGKEIRLSRTIHPKINFDNELWEIVKSRIAAFMHELG